MTKSVHYTNAFGRTMLATLGLVGLLAVGRTSCSRENTDQIKARASGQNFNFTEPTGYSAYTHFERYTAKRGDTVSELLANKYGFKGQELTQAVNRFVLRNKTDNIIAGKDYFF